MRIALVTSSATYVKDNYYHLLRELITGKALPEGASVVGAVFLKTHGVSMFLKSLGLLFNGVTGIGSLLLINSFKTVFFDRRVELCKKHDIPVFRFSSINSPGAVDAITSLDPHIIINLRTRDIFKRKILSTPRLGCINVHHGLLPEERGTFCDLWSWTHGRTVGFTIHSMNRKIDDGPVLRREYVDVSGIHDYIEIPYKSSLYEGQALKKVLQRISVDGCIKGEPGAGGNIRYYKNPSFGDIREMKKRGFRF